MSVDGIDPARGFAKTLIIVFGLAGLATCGPIACADPPYVHNVYLTTARPEMTVRGRWVFDISTPRRMDGMLSELAALGTNAITYHSAYRQDGADYTPRNPTLKRASRWPADARPVETFLEICAKHEMAGYLAVFLSGQTDPQVARLASLDMVDVFGGGAAMAGYVPPIEASPMRAIQNDVFLDICREVKLADPGLLIMDYPNGPYSPAVVRLIAGRAASGLVDIENIQFHAADKRLGNFVVSRGMTHLAMGICSRCRAIVHTHYKYGGKMAWLCEEDSYKVRQGAVITATTHGTSIFSFPHGFWGEETGPGGGDSLWRRLAWYEAIVAIQRLVPLYHDAASLAPIAVLIPAHTRLGGQEIVEQYWLPFAADASRGPAARLFLEEDQLCQATQVVICPAFEDCSVDQQKMLESLAASGRTVIVIGGILPQLAEDVSPRARRILGYLPLGKITAEVLSEAFLEALGGLSEKGVLTRVSGPTSRSYGKGCVIRAPSDAAWLEASLSNLAWDAARGTPAAENLPEGYVLEHWRTGATGRDVPFILLLGTEAGQRAEDVVLNVPWDGLLRPVWVFDRNSVRSLSCELSSQVLRVRVSRIGDEYAAVLLGSTRRPTLRPLPLVARCGTGQRVALSCRVTNTTGRATGGGITVGVPDGWPTPSPSEFHYRLAPGESVTWKGSVDVPADLERRPYFVTFGDGEQVQRLIVFPEDGSPQLISEKPAPAEVSRPASPRPPGFLDDQWRGVVAGEADDDGFARRIPGVCFMPSSAEWDPPTTLAGKRCRYAEILPRLGGANFFVNSPDPTADLLVKITYVAKKPGRLQVYDGHQYHPVGPMPETATWRTEELRVRRDLVTAPDADKDTAPGVNLLFDVRVDGVYVHSIAARCAPRSPLSGPATRPSESDKRLR